MSSSPLYIPSIGWHPVEPAELTLPAALDWYAYALELAEMAPDGVPRRDSLDVIRQRPGLVSLAIWVRLLSEDYEFRLIGDEVRERIGFPLKGIRLSQVNFNGAQSGIRAKYDRAVASRSPQCSAGFYEVDDSRQVQREAVIIPFADSDGRVTHLMVGMAYRDLRVDPSLATGRGIYTPYR